MRHDGIEYAIVDTPGMYSLFPITEEERVARRMIMEETSEILLHVVDASAPDAERRIEAVHRVLEEIGLSQIPELLILPRRHPGPVMTYRG